MKIIYTQQNETAEIEQVYQVLYDNKNNFISFFDARGRYLGSINLDKTDEFTAVDFNLSKEKVEMKKRKRKKNDKCINFLDILKQFISTVRK